MTRILTALHNDEAGFIVSAELVLISTIAVLGLIVGLAEVANGINEELEDVGSAFGQINQGYCVQGWCGHKGHVNGSSFKDVADYCDGQFDISCNAPIPGEARGGYGKNY
ncbi:MAG: branched-chain amino acid aminotransferase [Planctomycetaceae bacterium]|nr:branched-chain amino acid aminotransferase [Planctomycetaceae bacterium]